MQRHLENQPLPVVWDAALKIEMLRWVLNSCEKIRLSASGPSMAPSIRSGDLLEVKRLKKFFAMKVGRVYLFEVPGAKVYAHRLMRIDSMDKVPAYVFKGDGLFLNDPLVTAEAILGEVTHVRHRKFSLPLTLPGLEGVYVSLFKLWPWLKLFGRKATTIAVR